MSIPGILSSLWNIIRNKAQQFEAGDESKVSEKCIDSAN